MQLSSFVDILSNCTPNDWHFLYSIPETLYQYEGQFPLCFAEISPERIAVISDFAMRRTYLQKMYFMILDSQDSLGINRTDSTTPTKIIQFEKLGVAQSALDVFLKCLLESIDTTPISNIQSKPIPRFLVNGGKVLCGYELTFELAGLPTPC